MILFSKYRLPILTHLKYGLWLLFILTTVGFAQLSGTYTIGSGGNYATLTAAAADLNAQGVNGAVTFNIISGTYTEQFEIGVVTGVSQVNTITFQSQSGNAADVILQFVQVSGSNYITRLNGTDYITFQNLTYTSLGSSTYCRMFLIDDNSDNISIMNCVFNSISTTSTSNTAAHIWCDPTTTTSDNLLIESNTFNDGGPGILFSGVSTSNLSSGTQILNNEFNGVRRGVWLEFHDAPIIQGNLINAAGDYGIRTAYCDNELLITKNQVSTGSGYGIVLAYCDGGAPPLATPGLVANNFVSVAANSSDGIYLNYATYQNIYYNSVNARGGTGSNALVQSQGNNLNVVNNILAAPNGGYAYYINQPAAIVTSDYNNFYSPGNYLARWGSIDRWDLADLQFGSGKDANSRSVYPHFASATDLHTVAPWLDGVGTVLAEVTDDIDGDARGASPDIGADQFVPDPATTTPLSGTYTIGSGGTYADFNTAASDLLLKGVSAPVTFEVISGFYNEQVTFFEVAGASASDTVTFQSQSGNAADVTLFYPASGSSDNWIVRSYGADHLRFRNLTLQSNNAPGTTYGRIAYLVWGSRNLGFLENIFTGSTTTSTGNDLTHIHGLDMRYDTLTVRGNTFTNGSVGTRIDGINTTSLALGTYILNNTYTGVRRGIWLEYHDAPIIQGNLINAAGDYGIRTTYCDNELMITKNQVSTGSGYGIYLYYCDGGVPPVGIPGMVANNFVSVAANSSDGIYLNYATYQNIYYNSVNARGGTGSNALVQSQGNNLNVVNNILAALNGGRAYYVSQPSAINTSDYNDFYTTGPNLAYWGGTDVADLAALQTASSKDPNSVSANPFFVSNTDLHARAAAVDSVGTPLAEVTDDIDDEARDATYPDIGADEFIFSITGIDDDENNSVHIEVPKEFIVFQNYPNPFNPVTHIRYGLPKTSHVKIDLYNSLGQKVGTIVNTQQNAGYYNVKFDASHLGSGFYFYHMQAGNYSKIQKMLLIK